VLCSYKKEEIGLMRQARDGWCGGGTGERRDERLGLVIRRALLAALRT
jgi:hypothetical protein